MDVTVARRSVGGLRAFEVLFLNPRHEHAELGAGLFDGVLFASLEEGVVFLVAAFVFIEPVLGKLAGLNVLERGGQKSRAGLK